MSDDMVYEHHFGEWRVGIDDDLPNHVQVQFTDITDRGISAWDFYLDPAAAREMADSLIKFAEGITDGE